MEYPVPNLTFIKLCVLILVVVRLELLLAQQWLVQLDAIPEEGAGALLMKEKDGVLRPYELLRVAVENEVLTDMSFQDVYPRLVVSGNTYLLCARPCAETQQKWKNIVVLQGNTERTKNLCILRGYADLCNHEFYELKHEDYGVVLDPLRVREIRKEASTNA